MIKECLTNIDSLLENNEENKNEDVFLKISEDFKRIFEVLGKNELNEENL
jgi:hypothetical protein